MKIKINIKPKDKEMERLIEEDKKRVLAPLDKDEVLNKGSQEEADKGE